MSDVFKHTIKLKVIPRNEGVHTIVPIPPNEINLRAARKKPKKGAKQSEARRLGMLRDDI